MDHSTRDRQGGQAQGIDRDLLMSFGHPPWTRRAVELMNARRTFWLGRRRGRRSPPPYPAVVVLGGRR
jgi:hypothetical protein